jgi:iron complex outermembrane receptor protein
MFRTHGRRAVALTLLSLATMPAQAADIEEIVVTAELRDRTATGLPASATVLDGQQVTALAIQHFEELTAVVPNLNWSGDGNRARYLQIRGVGELEQYEGAPNPSVGFVVDDIDFSGIGTIGTLFDIDRVEVLRGPQGTRYGANALAGLVYLRSTAPSAHREGILRVSAGGDGLFAGGLALGGPVDDAGRLRYRFSAQQHRSDGFRHNAYLGRDDTNGRDETTLRGRIAWSPAASLDLDLALLYIDVDDGYDAFALDNSYTVLSDKPGRDAQASAGASLRVQWSLSGELALTALSSVADSTLHFDFDADWGNPDSWAPVTYDYESTSLRERRTVSQEFRLAGTRSERTGWILGLYAARLREDLDSRNRGDYYDPFYDFADALDERLRSEYKAGNRAVFGRLEQAIGRAWTVAGGLRMERRTADYDDTNGIAQSVDDTMLGGELSLTRLMAERQRVYLRLARGYKAGGFNLGPVPAGERRFAAEFLWSLEVGLKSRWPDRALQLDLAVFRNRREDQQVRTSVQLVPGDPASFVFFTDNAARGTASGVEATMRWTPGDAWDMYATVGLLDAEFENFRTAEGDLSGRDQPHAPNYTFAAGGSYTGANGWYVRADINGKDAFYFDVSHDERAAACVLVNGRFGYGLGPWRAELWARNLADRYCAVRGFYFGNEPPDFPPTLYTRAGDARQVGLTLERSF